MKLSTRARYGLKALIDLGLHSANEAISLQSIAAVSYTHLDVYKRQRNRWTEGYGRTL